MSAKTPFRAPLDDIFFSLIPEARADEVEGFDADFVGETGGHFAVFAEGEIAPLDALGDRQGCRLENGRVRMPDGYAAVYRAYAEQGWPGPTVPEPYGGLGMDALVSAVTSEIFTGADHALQMVTGRVLAAADRHPEVERIRRVAGGKGGRLARQGCGGGGGEAAGELTLAGGAVMAVSHLSLTISPRLVRVDRPGPAPPPWPLEPCMAAPAGQEPPGSLPLRVVSPAPGRSYCDAGNGSRRLHQWRIKG